jgi:dTDP-4-dehydrorhamnose reductase
VSKPVALVLGGSGQLGTALRTTLAGDYDVQAPPASDVPLTDPDVLEQRIRAYRPSVLVNAAAFTKVDDAETEEARANAVNALAPAVMARVCRELTARFVHMSTDYVFDGTGVMPYTADAPTHPLNVYGATKRAGETAVLAANPSAVVLRTAWVHSGVGVNFVGTAVRVLGAGRPMKVVDDQVGTPTRTSTLADAIARVLQRPEVRGIHHVTDAGVASWYDVACCVLETLEADGRAPLGASVAPVDSSAFPRPAARPKISILDTYATRAALDWTPPHWRTGVIASTREWLAATPATAAS